MPTYVYKFEKTGETIEVQQSFSDDTLTKYKHPSSGRMMSVKKVFQPVGVTFKGSGFFKNDNRDKKSTTMTSTDSASSGDGGSSDSKESTSDSSSSSDSKTTDSKTTEKSDSKTTETKKSDSKKSTASASSSG